MWMGWWSVFRVRAFCFSFFPGNDFVLFVTNPWLTLIQRKRRNARMQSVNMSLGRRKSYRFLRLLLGVCSSVVARWCLRFGFGSTRRVPLVFYQYDYRSNKRRKTKRQAKQTPVLQSKPPTLKTRFSVRAARCVYQTINSP